MTLVLSPTGAPLGTNVELQTPTRQSIGAQALDLVATPFDVVVRTLADLGTPVAGYYQLATGSYAFAASLNLGTNGLQVPVGETAYIKGIGWEHTQTSSAANGLLVDGTALIESMRVTTTGANGVQVTGAYVQFKACEFIGATNGMVISGAGAGTVIVDNGLFTGGTDGIVIDANSGTRLWIDGSWVIGTTDAILVDGNVGYISVSQGRLQSATNGIRRNAGTVTNVRVDNCEFNAPVGINWASANVPQAGLLVTNNIFLTTPPWSGHNPASAKVMYRVNSNVDTGSLETETTIVP